MKKFDEIYYNIYLLDSGRISPKMSKNVQNFFFSPSHKKRERQNDMFFQFKINK